MNSISNSVALVRPLIPVIVGPTAVGKTAISIELAGCFNLEIVSCDSRQIYKRMNIGTAKPTAVELAGRPYHLIDLVEPDYLYSAAKYRVDAERAMDGILAAKRIPVIVGGTGLYLRALMAGLFETPDPDIEFRAKLNVLSTEELQNRLQAVDPQTAAALRERNRSRLIRALEIHRLTGRGKSELASSGKYPQKRFEFAVFLLTRSRENLYQIINSRVDNMIRDGLIAEVEALVAEGFGQSPVLRRTVGYREVLDYLSGATDCDRCIDLIKQRTRNYAKRQLTWFRHQVTAVQVDLNDAAAREVLWREIEKLKLDTKLC